MAAEYLALADLLKVNDMNLADIEVTDILDDAPVLKALAAATASNGAQHKYVKETGAPVVGFRSPNAGRDNSKSTDTLVTIDLKILDASNEIDQAIADAYSKGAEAYIARESKRHLKAAFFGAERQIINGTGIDADGFVGLAQALLLANAMTVDATGSTASTGSSVYLIRTNDDGVDATVIAGGENEGEEGVIAVKESVTIKATDATGKTYPAYYTPIFGWLGLQIGSANSVARICNLTAQSGKGLTDDLIYEALSRFPASRMPNLIVCGRRSIKQLRQSRTAVNATGAPAPMPTDVDGIPVIVTDAITATEAILA
jgi:hypothetical protein